MADNPNTGTILPASATKDDGDGRKYVVWPDGSKFYLRPTNVSAQGSGGMINNPDNWNPKTGQWEKGGVNWGALIPWLGLGAIGGGVAAAALASTAPAVVASQAATGATAAGGAGAAGAGTAAATGAAVAPAVAGASAVAPAAAGAGLGSLGWASLAANVGSQAVGAYLQNRANNKATDAQSQAAKDALDFTKQVYGDRKTNLQSYIDAGQAAVAKGMALQGLSLPKVNPAPMATDPNHIAPGQPFPASMVPGNPANSGGTLSQIGQQQQQPDSGLVRMLDPKGQIRMVPSALQTQALAAGGKLLTA